MLELAAVEGEVFHRGAVQALASEETQVTPRLAALVRKQLIGRGKARLAGEDAFCFRHLLIRDAAYASLPKAARAKLHERLADWLEERRANLVELDELIGYTLSRPPATDQSSGSRTQSWQNGQANTLPPAVGARSRVVMSALLPRSWNGHSP